MKKYTIRVDEEQRLNIEEIYNKERQYCVSQSIDCKTMNAFMVYCLGIGLEKHNSDLDRGINGNAELQETAMETMDRLLKECS